MNEEIELTIESEANVVLPQVITDEETRKANEAARIANEQIRITNEARREQAINEIETEVEAISNNQNNLQTQITNEVANRITGDSDLQNQITNGLSNISNGTPLVASSTSGMTDTTRIYVNTTDGHWYYYNSTSWTDGGVYQATEIEDKSVTAEKTNFLTNEHINLIDPNKEARNKRYNTSGVITDTTSYDLSDFVPIESGKTYYSTTNLNVAIFDEDKEFLGIKTSSDWSTVLSQSSARVYSIQFASNVKYARFHFTANATGYVTSSDYIKNQIDLKRIGFENGECITLTETMKNAIYKEIEPKLNYKNIFHYNYNRVNPETITIGSYHGIDGSIINNQLYNESDYIEVKENDKCFWNERLYFSAYDKDKNWLFSLNNAYYDFPYIVPKGVKYIKIVIRASNTTPYFNIGNTDCGYLQYGVEVINETERNSFKNDLAIYNNLNGKVIDVFGDSITSTDYITPYWGDIIASATGCVVNNYGISGTTLAHTHDRHLYDYHHGRLDTDEIGYVENDPTTWSTGNCFCERFTKVNSNADAIVLMGGTNDNGVQLGEWNSTDTTTFYGALNVLLQGISKRMAGKKILVCTPMQSANAYNSNVANAIIALDNKTATDTLSLQLRAEAIKRKCEQYAIHCLDLYNTSGINGIDDDKIYYKTNDTLHPSAYGQNRLASLIKAELEKMF